MLNLQRDCRAQCAKLCPCHGYLFRLSFTDQTLLEVAEFISFERRCCPFLSFQISLNESDEAVTVQLTGRDGVKEFLAAEFGL